MIQSIRRIGFFLFILVFLGGCPASKEKKAVPPSTEASVGSPAKSSNSDKSQTNYTTPTDAVKTFFDAVNNEKYDVAWQSLTKKSKDKFVSMVAEDEKMDPIKVRELFDQNQLPIQLGFWKSFRESSKIAAIVPNATYKKLSESGNESVVELSSGTVTLDNKAIKDGDSWKMGYIESFME